MSRALQLPPEAPPHPMPAPAFCPHSGMDQARERPLSLWRQRGGPGGRTECQSENVQYNNFQMAAGRPLARLQRDFPAQGVGRLSYAQKSLAQLILILGFQ